MQIKQFTGATIDEVLTQVRAELVAGGRRRADQLSMARLAERYVEIYRGLLAG